MKTLYELGIIESYRPQLKREFKFNNIGIFCSYTRDEAGNTSDIDILVELLGLNIDLVTVNTLKPELNEKILNEAVYA